MKLQKYFVLISCLMVSGSLLRSSEAQQAKDLNRKDKIVQEMESLQRKEFFRNIYKNQDYKNLMGFIRQGIEKGYTLEIYQNIFRSYDSLKKFIESLELEQKKLDEEEIVRTNKARHEAVNDRLKSIKIKINSELTNDDQQSYFTQKMNNLGKDIEKIFQRNIRSNAVDLPTEIKNIFLELNRLDNEINTHLKLKRPQENVTTTYHQPQPAQTRPELQAATASDQMKREIERLSRKILDKIQRIKNEEIRENKFYDLQKVIENKKMSDVHKTHVLEQMLIQVDAQLERGSEAQYQPQPAQTYSQRPELQAATASDQMKREIVDLSRKIRDKIQHIKNEEIRNKRLFDYEIVTAALEGITDADRIYALHDLLKKVDTQLKRESAEQYQPQPAQTYAKQKNINELQGQVNMLEAKIRNNLEFIEEPQRSEFLKRLNNINFYESFDDKKRYLKMLLAQIEKHLNLTEEQLKNEPQPAQILNKNTPSAKDTVLRALNIAKTVVARG